MTYTLLKHLHLLTITLSGAGFLARLVGSLAGAAWVRSRPVRVLPHVNDTVLLGSAIAMLVVAGLNPLTQPWLLAKIAALLVYIVLGMLALKPGRPFAVRLTAGIAALVVFLYIVSVAIGKQPAGAFVWLS